MYLSFVGYTLIAWVVGLFLDANIDFGPTGFVSFRILLPILAMGICILKSIKDNENKKDDNDK